MASNGQMRVYLQESNSKLVMNMVTDEGRHNLLRVASATRHSNQREIQQKQVLFTVPAACFPNFR